MVYFVLAMCVILLIICLYLKSPLILVFVLHNVIYSFGIAYFLYFIVFRIPHMPFMALLTILLLIAIGADDVFIFCDTYEQVKSTNPNADITLWISQTMRHAAVSILVTSATTAAALYANVISEITDIKGFGIISGTALIVNYVLMVTWIPAAVIFVEKLDNCGLANLSCSCCEKINDFMSIVTVTFFYQFLPTTIKKLWPLWIILFLGLGIAGVVLTFVTPKLDLPTSQDFALFDRDSAIEVWFQDLKYKFRYYQEKDEQRASQGMDLVAAWGILGEDNGNPLDPESKSTMVLDKSFDLTSEKSQIWMLEFCHTLRDSNISFVSKDSIKRRQCALDIFNKYVITECSALQNVLVHVFDNKNLTLEQLNITDCCGRSSTPIPAEIFEKCYYHFSVILFYDRQLYSSLGTAYWDSKTRKLSAYGFHFQASQGWTANYADMDPFYHSMQDFMDKQIDTAPPGLRNGWMTAFPDNFQLYDLQRALGYGTYAAIGVSMAAGFAVMLVTSLNIIITFYAIFTIFLTISMCSGILVLLGWELNIVESVTLTMSVGLSIDFCIHYGMGYRLSKLETRKMRVQDSFQKVGSAIFMAAATTFLAGAVIMPSIILFYIQLGTFLMLVMAMSWLFATFFFQSVCYVAGPQGTFGQIPSPFKLCRTHSPHVAANSDHAESGIPPVPAIASSTVMSGSLNDIHNSHDKPQSANKDYSPGLSNPAYETQPGGT